MHLYSPLDCTAVPVGRGLSLFPLSLLSMMWPTLKLESPDWSLGFSCKPGYVISPADQLYLPVAKATSKDVSSTLFFFLHPCI